MNSSAPSPSFFKSHETAILVSSAVVLVVIVLVIGLYIAYKKNVFVPSATKEATRLQEESIAEHFRSART